MKQGQTVIIDPKTPNRHRLMVQEALEVLERLGCKPQHTQPAEARGLLGWVMFYLLQLLAPLVYFFYGVRASSHTPRSLAVVGWLGAQAIPTPHGQNPEKNQAHNEQTQLLCLAPEILFHVLGFLSARDLAVVQLSCSDLAHHGAPTSRALGTSRLSDPWRAAAGDDRLWRQLCERDWAIRENMLVEYLGMNWHWVYRSKVVNRGFERDGKVGTRTSGENVRWEGHWYVETSHRRPGGRVTDSTAPTLRSSLGCGLEGYGLYVGLSHVIEGQWKSGLFVFGRVSYRPQVSHRNGDFYVGQWAESWETGTGVCYYAKREHKSNCHRDVHVGCSTGYKYEGGWQKGYWRTSARPVPQSVVCRD
jgi:hypothetical protein